MSRGVSFLFPGIELGEDLFGAAFTTVPGPEGMGLRNISTAARVVSGLADRPKKWCLISGDT